MKLLKEIWYSNNNEYLSDYDVEKNIYLSHIYARDGLLPKFG